MPPDSRHRSRPAFSSHPLLVQKRQRLQRSNFEGLATADIRATKLVVSPHHVRLSLGKLGPVALIRMTGQLRSLASYYPGNFVFSWLSAFGAVKGMRPLLSGFVEKVPFFHVLHFSGATK
jgi:hypothetical protein